MDVNYISWQGVVILLALIAVFAAVGFWVEKKHGED